MSRIGLADGGETTVYVVVHPRRATRMRVTCFEEARRLDHWVVVDDDDREGFSSAVGQFDSDITAERHPRCALGVNEDELFAVCCDGRRTGVDAGLDLAELARLLVSLGATDAINLDGGGSATLVHRGHLLNRPYTSVDQPGPESRPVVTALVFDSLPSG